MGIDRKRRALLSLSAGLTAATLLPAWSAVARGRTTSSDAAQSDAWPDLLGSWEQDTVHYAGLWTASRRLRGVALPSRAHGVLADPRNSDQGIVVGRRPGGYLMRFDARRALEIAVVKTDGNRVFNGHAAFSADGETIYTTENDIGDGSGWIGVRDATTLHKRNELPTHGLGPHAMLVELDGALLVANGGILTLSATGRAKLNTERLDSSLVRIDARTGELIGQWRLADSRLSIRHVARTTKGKVGIALQSEHPSLEQREVAPLFALFDGVRLSTVAEPRGGARLGGYGGDVACMTRLGQAYFAVSCTHANLVAWWDDEGRWQGALPLRNACALTPFGDAIIAAGEEGEIARMTAQRAEPFVGSSAAPSWDNHMVAYF